MDLDDLVANLSGAPLYSAHFGQLGSESLTLVANP